MLFDFFENWEKLEETAIDNRKELFENVMHSDINFSDVKGQENVKRALKVAAAGGHKIIKLYNV